MLCCMVCEYDTCSDCVYMLVNCVKSGESCEGMVCIFLLSLAENELVTLYCDFSAGLWLQYRLLSHRHLVIQWLLIDLLVLFWL